MILVKKLKFFHLLCLSKIDREKLFPDVLDKKEAYSSILDKSFSAPTAEGRILDHGFTEEEIPYIYILPFKILKEPKTDHVPSQNYSQHFTYPI